MKQAMINYIQTEKHDYFATPDYAVTPLLRYLKNMTIWEPTDTYGVSQITTVLQTQNKVIATSEQRFDFLTDTPDFAFDCIVTNPPFSIKDKFIEKCIQYKKKWALLLPITALEGIGRGKMFNTLGNSLGLIIFNRRINYQTEKTKGGNWFNSSWYCYDILPADQQLIFEELQK